jgi:hypothetical protein
MANKSLKRQHFFAILSLLLFTSSVGDLLLTNLHELSPNSIGGEANLYSLLVYMYSKFNPWGVGGGEMVGVKEPSILFGMLQ